MTTKTKAIIGAVVGGIVLLALLGGGGPPSELEVKGLRLGMPIEEAARVMLGHGMPPGESAEWDPGGSLIRVRTEYDEALAAHYRALLGPKFEAAGVDSFGKYLTTTLSPEQLQRAADEWPHLHYMKVENTNIPGLMSGWDELGLPPFMEASQLFPEMEQYLAEKYPAGPPYAMGGLWDGKEPLKLQGNGLRTTDWTLSADESGAVDSIRLTPGAVAELFGAGDMRGEEFAASFSSAYGVPLEPTAEMEDLDIAVFTGDILKTGWVCVNRDGGWAVTISEHKMLDIKSITPAAQQSFD